MAFYRRATGRIAGADILLQIVALRNGGVTFLCCNRRESQVEGGQEAGGQMKIESHLMTEKRRSLRGVWVVILVLLLAAAGAAVYFSCRVTRSSDP